jgi:rhodanese-related sulfurtransferase
MRLARVGMESIAGYLDDGIAGWAKGGFDFDSIPQVAVIDLADLLSHDPDQVTVLDVREMAEVEAGAIPNSRSIPLGKLKARIPELPSERLIVVHCKSGYRSSIAASILRHAGIRNVVNLMGGFEAWKAAGLPCTVPVPAVA